MKIDDILKKYKSSESLLSFVLGAVVVIVVGNQIVGYLSKNLHKDSSPKEDINTETSVNTTNGSKYVVKKGEYLYKIAEELLGDGNLWPTIAKANNITNPNIIEEGDQLTIPEKPVIISSGETIVSNNTNTTTGSITADKYTVLVNDSLWKICVRAYGDGYQWPKVAKANNLKNPDLLEKGQILTLPR